METNLQQRWGDSIDNPTPEQLKEALAELDIEDDEHPDTWLTATIEGGDWSISAFGSGLTILVIYNSETETETENEYELHDISREQQFQLWQQLQRGELEAIKALPWQLRP